MDALGEVALEAFFADLVAHDHERVLAAALRTNQTVMHLRTDVHQCK